ncbi:MAG: 3-oxoacid CoA-transferase subunit A [Alphaproteobacteria bacterium]|jgi:3-oxoadipate CoA-transferase, alpha subunit|nr:3-oxoacid CoA-transferase subunit A [Alphaproteobacteria bacterium]
MKQKKVETIEDALDRISDGDTVLVGGFGFSGIPEKLIDGVCERGLRDLTIVNNSSGAQKLGVAKLLHNGCVGKVICSFPWGRESKIFTDLYEAGKVDLEIVPQGILAERMRAAGAGLGGILSPSGVGTEIAEGKSTHEIDGVEYLIEAALPGDIALVKATKVDPRGNLIYRLASQNMNPVMAMAAKYTIVEADEEVALGDLDPEHIMTAGVFVDRYYVTGRYKPDGWDGAWS